MKIRICLIFLMRRGKSFKEIDGIFMLNDKKNTSTSKLITGSMV